MWPWAELDHGLVEVIFSANGSRTSLLSARVRRQAHYSSILPLQASGIICHNRVWHDHATECIKILLPSQASSLAPVCASGGQSDGEPRGPGFLHRRAAGRLSEQGLLSSCPERGARERTAGSQAAGVCLWTSPAGGWLAVLCVQAGAEHSTHCTLLPLLDAWPPGVGWQPLLLQGEPRVICARPCQALGWSLPSLSACDQTRGRKHGSSYDGIHVHPRSLRFS